MFIFRLLRGLLRRLFRFIYFLGGAAAVLLIVLLIVEGSLFLLKLPPESFSAKQSYTAIALADTNPTDRDVRLFIQPNAIRELARLYTNLKLSPQWFPFTQIGPEPTLGAITVDATLGQLRASADVELWRMTFAVELSMQFDRIEVLKHLKKDKDGKYVNDPKDDDCDIIFVPHIDRIRLTGAAQSLANSILPRLSIFSERALGAWADRHLNWIREDTTYQVELPVKVPRRLILPPRLDDTDEAKFRALKTKKSDDEATVIGSLTTHTGMDEGITAFFNYGAPLITPAGIWIFANIQFQEPKWLTRQDAQALLSPDPPLTPEQIKTINDLSKFAGEVPDKASLELTIKTNALVRMVDEMTKRLDAAHRTVNISTIESKDEIFRLQGRDDNVQLLEAFKFFADIPQDKGVRGTILFDKLTSKKTPQGIELSAVAAGNAKTSVRFTAAALGMQQAQYTADFSAEFSNLPLRFRLNALASSKMVKGKKYQAELWGLDGYCASTIVAFKMGSGRIGDVLPVTFDSFEVDIPIRLFKEKSRASLMFSSLPSRQALVKTAKEDKEKVKDKEKEKEKEKSAWDTFFAQYSKPAYVLVPPSKGLEITVEPVATDISEDIYRIDVALKFNASPEEEFSDDEKKDREDTLNQIKDTRFPGPQECGSALPSVTFKNLGLGPADKLWEALLKVVEMAKTKMEVEKARVRLAIALLQGDDIGPAARQLLEKEVTNLGAQVDGVKSVIEAGLKNADQAIDDAKRKKDEAEARTAAALDPYTPPGAPKPSKLLNEKKKACKKLGVPC